MNPIEQKYTINGMTEKQFRNLKTQETKPQEVVKQCPFRAGASKKDCRKDCALFSENGCNTEGTHIGGKCPICPDYMRCQLECNFYINGVCTLFRGLKGL